jgi:AcrR family transcriptional regulator
VMSEIAPRAYRSTLREQQALATRLRVIRAAGDQFSASGFHATTMASIARAAGVSTETVKATASKSELLVAAFEVTFAGAEGRQTLTDTPAGEGVLDLPPEQFLGAVLGAIAAANERGHALWTVVLGAALSDPAVFDALGAILDRRRGDYRLLVDELIARGARVPDAAHAADELSFLLSPEGYQQLVVQSGWTRDAYVAWLHEGVARLTAVPAGERR